MGTDGFVPKYAYHKPVTAKFRDKCEWQNGFKVDIKGGLALYTEGSEVNIGTGDGVHRWGSRRGHIFSRGFHTTVFQAEIYPIWACGIANMEKDYSCRDIEVFGSFQIIIIYPGTAINP